MSNITDNSSEKNSNKSVTDIYVKTLKTVYGEGIVRELIAQARGLYTQIKKAPIYDVSYFEEIFKTKNLRDWYETYHVYLDDIRPIDSSYAQIFHEKSLGINCCLVICRSADEFYRLVETAGELPSFISFDHDLGDQVPTGHDVAKWIIEQTLDDKYKLPQDFSFHVHSANPPGAANINGILNSFLNHMKVQMESNE